VTTPTEHITVVEAAGVPAVAMLATQYETDPGAPGCWFGGAPTLPPEIPWPCFEFTFSGAAYSVPMHFFAQIDLAQVPRVPGLPDFPGSGTLFVFYDPAVAPRAEDNRTNGLADGSGSALIFVPGDVSHHPPRAAPAFPDLAAIEYLETWVDWAGGNAWPRWPMAFATFMSYPSIGEALEPQYLSALIEQEDDAYERLAERIGRPIGAVHQIFGASGRETRPTAENLARRGDRTSPAIGEGHVLLFVIRGDETTGHAITEQVPFGFWIDRFKLAAGNFESVLVWSDT